ncbi:MAG: heme-binding domain-containing protein [Rikenellaceae bacterium]|nr:heme-binding domain-containing protein [Rikenellaceae bacterium]
MKKSKLLILALVLAVVLVAVYRISNRPPSAEYTPEARVAAILVQGGCLDCHTQDAEPPFYADFPIAGKIVRQDIDSGFRAFDIAPLYEALVAGQLPRPVDVAKVEKVALDKRMPEPKYYLVHWGSQMTDAKRDIIVEWVRKYRAEYYADGVEGERAGEPVRPIAEPTDIDARKALLGYALYHDARLSVDNTVSCASCHGLNTAGVDNKQYSEGVEGQKGGVNAPTTYNAVYNFVQFWDGRAGTLAEQAAGPPLNPVEMASTSFDEIVAKLEKDRAFAAAFEAVYPDGLNQANITNAIEEFERTLVTPNSAFDKWLKGDDTALTEEEMRGYELFKKYDCATCHVGANLGGESYELMGLRRHYFAERGLPLTEEDNGRYKQTMEERDRHRFKVPGLRNVELTWPYYHDGTRATLSKAVADMAIYQSGVELTEEENAAIVAFLRTLTGEFEGVKLSNENVQE